MKHIYPQDCKSAEQRKQYRIDARKSKKVKARALVNSPLSRTAPGNGWQRGYGINQYAGNTKTK